jgi:hypothetical protein
VSAAEQTNTNHALVKNAGQSNEQERRKRMTTTTAARQDNNDEAREGTGPSTTLDCRLRPIPGIENAWCVPKLLSDDECRSLHERAARALLFDHHGHGDGDVPMLEHRDDRHRTNRSVVVIDKELAERVWERLQQDQQQQQPALLSPILIRRDSRIAGIEECDIPTLQGKWIAVGLNEYWRVAVYDRGGHFGPHRDAHRGESDHRRSFITVNGYLVGLPPGYGGATRFLHDDQHVFLDEATGRYAPSPGSVLHTVPADAAGKAVLFYHGLLHDGEPIAEDCPVQKWIFRSEIMYRRDEASIVAVDESLTAEQREARQHLRTAQRLEANRQIAEAIQCYKKAYRLDPTLEERGDEPKQV